MFLFMKPEPHATYSVQCTPLCTLCAGMCVRCRAVLVCSRGLLQHIKPVGWEVLIVLHVRGRCTWNPLFSIPLSSLFPSFPLSLLLCCGFLFILPTLRFILTLVSNTTTHLIQN